MKSIFGKRWHRIPVALVSALLAVTLMASGAFAAYSFMTVAVDVEVRESIVLGLWDTWDNLEPYGAVDDVEITLGGTEIVPIVSITTAAETPYVGEGFTPGESIVIPVNFRNASSEEFTLGALVSGNGGLILECVWVENTGAVTETHPDGDLAYGFKDDGNWVDLDTWTATIPGYGGHSGSARIGAQVLFVRITAPKDMAPGVCNFNVAFTRE